MSERLVIFGAGGHAKVIIDAVERQRIYEVALLVDADPSRVGTSVLGHEVQEEALGFEALSEGIRHAIVAIGNNEIRRRIADIARGKGLTLATVIHPGSVVARSAQLGAGTLVMPGAIINADARVGANVIVNTGAVIEHDCRIGDDVHIGPHATLCGGVAVGAGSLIGAGATVLVGVSIGQGVLVGAGSTVLAGVPDGARVAGSPCRPLESKP